jgi:hypothetical protein
VSFPEIFGLGAALGVAAGVGWARMWGRRQVSEISRERDENWDFACRLLESPEFYMEQRGVLDAIGSPTYGEYGRIPNGPVASLRDIDEES